MKIALVVPGGVDRSGEVRVIPAFLAIIERLARHHEVHVFALRQEPRPATWPLAGATVHNAGGRVSTWRSVGQILREHRRAPFHGVQSLFSGTPGFVACLAATRMGLPYAVHVGGGELLDLPEIGYGGRRHWFGRWRESLVLRAADAVSAASDPMLRDLRALGVPAQRIPLGVDPQRWPPREPQPRDRQAPARLVHVASLNRVKDQHTLLQALARLARDGHEFVVDIVGEDTLRGEIQRLAGELLPGDRVRFHGFLPQAPLRELMLQAHLCVVSSRHEAGPLVMLEAAMLGIPTVGTNVGHVAEWAPEAALAVPVGDSAALAASIAALLADEPRRLRLAAAALARAREEDADHTARAFQAIYQRFAEPLAEPA
jgi:glycosyltransferase involved in cell wall biosynthesis